MIHENTQQVGPKVRVRIEYECNGCQFHTVEEDKDGRMGVKYHVCNHPAVLAEYSCPQFMNGGSKDLTVYHISKAPKYLCPYLIAAGQEE